MLFIYRTLTCTCNLWPVACDLGYVPAAQTLFSRDFQNRAVSVWPWNENPRTKQKQQTNGCRAIWLVYRTDINARGFWLVKQNLGWKNFTPENFLEINRYFALTSYCNTIGQSRNAFSILGFLGGGGDEKAMFWSFHPLADKTNNELLRNHFSRLCENCSNVYVRQVHFTKTPRFVACSLISGYSGVEYIAHVKRISFTSEALGYTWATFTRQWTSFRPVECSCV